MFQIFGTPKAGDVLKVSGNPDDVMPEKAKLLFGTPKPIEEKETSGETK